MTRPASEGQDSRELRLVTCAIDRYGLDLTGATIFTEAASGPFIWTPIIALMAGADRVFTYAAAGQFGLPEELQRGVMRLASELGLDSRLTPVSEKVDGATADIITNSAGLRPLDADFIAALQPNSVIPLMWETWEFRSADLDLVACYERDILVLGTNEHHPDLGTFRYVAAVGVKLLFECGLEIVDSRVLVVGGGAFGLEGVRLLTAMGAEVDHVSDSRISPETSHYRWVGATLGEDRARDAIGKCDAMLFLEHELERLLIGASGDLSVTDLLTINPSIRIAHVSGAVDFEALKSAGIHFCPGHAKGRPRAMSVTTGHVGPRPVIDLNAAGLRVGEIMWRARRGGNDISMARAIALENPLCHGFAKDQLRALGIMQ